MSNNNSLIMAADVPSRKSIPWIFYEPRISRVVHGLFVLGLSMRKIAKHVNSRKLHLRHLSKGVVKSFFKLIYPQDLHGWTASEEELAQVDIEEILDMPPARVDNSTPRHACWIWGEPLIRRIADALLLLELDDHKIARYINSRKVHVRTVYEANIASYRDLKGLAQNSPCEDQEPANTQPPATTQEQENAEPLVTAQEPANAEPPAPAQETANAEPTPPAQETANAEPTAPAQEQANAEPPAPAQRKSINWSVFMRAK